MKLLPAVVALFFIVFIVVTCLVFVKLDSMETRLGSFPTYADIDRRFSDLEARQESLAGESFKARLKIHERLAALEAGVGKPVLSGPQTVEYLISSLKNDLIAKNEAAMNPDQEAQLEERISTHIEKLLDKQDAGEDVLDQLLMSLRTSKDHDWRRFLLGEVIWQMGSGAVESLMEFFRDRDNESLLRNVAAQAVMNYGGRAQSDEFARALADPKEALYVRTGLANLFHNHPVAAAEPGLIEGVEGQWNEENKEYTLYAPQHRVACLRALGKHDSAAVVAFLEEFILDTVVGDPAIQVEPILQVMALQAYHSIQREQVQPLFKSLLTEPALSAELAELINDYLAEYK